MATGVEPTPTHMAQALLADDKLVLLTEAGELALATVSPNGLEVLGMQKRDLRVHGKIRSALQTRQKTLPQSSELGMN